MLLSNIRLQPPQRIFFTLQTRSCLLDRRTIFLIPPATPIILSHLASTSLRPKSVAQMSKRSAPNGSGHHADKKQKNEAPEDALKHPSTSRGKEIDAHLPFDALTEALRGQAEKKSVSKVAHWFRAKDLRIQDNVGLQHASALAQKEGKPLIGLFLNCPPEYEWHGTSPARADFILENLRMMQEELKELGIPLVILEADERKNKVPTVLKFLKDNEVSHVFANYEYEVDELRRDTRFVRDADGDCVLALFHDQTVMEPGKMTTGAGGPMKVFTPYHKAWLATVKSDPSLLNTVSPPSKQDASPVSSLFDSPIPSPPESKEFASTEEQNRIRKLWPAGHAAGMKRMDDFIKNKIEGYAETRVNPGKDTTSRMSPYFSAGVVSMREILTKLKSYNKGKADFSAGGCSPGVAGWVREIVFRELYRQTTLYTPQTVMNLPQNLKFDFVEWEKDEEGWYKWCEGKTGMPLVDAGMRQLNHEAWMHNRARMNVSSYLYCNLLIDYRRGERYFAEHLVDWDLSNNTQGWEPSYTVFNPVSQAERNDPEGEYIRKWVPELKDIKGKAIFDPHARLGKKEFGKLGYPAPHVDWNKTKARCMERFKRDMKDAEP